MNKQYVLVIGTVVLAVSAYFVFQSFTPEEPSSASSFDINRFDENAINVGQEVPSELGHSIEPKFDSSNGDATKLIETASNEYDPLDTLTKVSELQKELIKLGYFVPPEFVASYESFNEEALLQMAENGDMVAINALKNKYAQAEQWEAYRTTQEEAVLQGSIQDISDLHDIEFAKYSGEDSRDRLIKSAAYAELAALRGSNVSVYYAITNFNENGIEFSPSELTHISQMAKDMLKQINVKRRDRGKDALVKIDDSQLINSKPDNSLSGWGREFVVNRQK